jgi:hypothetical protein
MKLVAALAVLALVLPAAALAKGPAAATMEGPGLGGPASFPGDEGGGPLGRLVNATGWFPAVFGQEPDPLLARRPAGDLGPRYTITYLVPGGEPQPDMILQDVYPYADGGPVTYVAAGQAIFDTTTHGGWFRATPDLKPILVEAGLPEVALGPSGGDDSFPTLAVSGALLAAVAAGLGIAFLARRRARPAPA